MVGSFYDVLGVPATATPDDIRAAFRRRARAVHPDRQHEAVVVGSEPEGQGDAAMRELNEAWRVLGNPTRRRDYDRLLRAGSGSGAGEARPVVATAGLHPDDVPYTHALAEPGDLGVVLARALPWVAAVAVLVGIFVFTAFAASNTEEGISASNLVGECIRLDRGGVVTKVPCGEPNDGRVDLVTVGASLCPAGANAVRLPTRGNWLCLREVDP